VCLNTVWMEVKLYVALTSASVEMNVQFHAPATLLPVAERYYFAASLENLPRISPASFSCNLDLLRIAST